MKQYSRDWFEEDDWERGLDADTPENKWRREELVNSDEMKSWEAGIAQGFYDEDDRLREAEDMLEFDMDSLTDGFDQAS